MYPRNLVRAEHGQFRVSVLGLRYEGACVGRAAIGVGVKVIVPVLGRGAARLAGFASCTSGELCRFSPADSLVLVGGAIPPDRAESIHQERLVLQRTPPQRRTCRSAVRTSVRLGPAAEGEGEGGTARKAIETWARARG